MARIRLHNDDLGYESNCFVCEASNEAGLRIPFFHDTEREMVVAQLLGWLARFQAAAGAADAATDTPARAAA